MWKIAKNHVRQKTERCSLDLYKHVIGDSDFLKNN